MTSLWYNWMSDSGFQINEGIRVHGYSDFSATRESRRWCCLRCYSIGWADSHIQQKVTDGQTDNTLIHSPFLSFILLLSIFFLSQSTSPSLPSHNYCYHFIDDNCAVCQLVPFLHIDFLSTQTDHEVINQFIESLLFLNTFHSPCPQVSRSSFIEGIFLFFLGIRENSKIREYSTYSTFAVPYCVRAQRRDGASRAAERSSA